ncbi:uncharacterized protein [Lolium perenne]|uniref:uncharacterized protein n=1 Tax=Lolium perenne TaxID=4522 RepID=UPI003A9969B2
MGSRRETVSCEVPIGEMEGALLKDVPLILIHGVFLCKDRWRISRLMLISRWPLLFCSGEFEARAVVLLLETESSTIIEYGISAVALEITKYSTIQTQPWKYNWLMFMLMLTECRSLHMSV